jgi:CRISPR-associated protein Cas1
MSALDAEAPPQIPARMLNEFAYCPRLFYLEHVQQEWAHSADTLDGRLVHRRVDRPEGRMPAAADLSEQVRLHSRSVLVGSERLGATAQIDLIETDEGRVIPVDYKRGKPPDVAEGAYEPERVQLCLQGLLLRENGYECEEGALYFAAAQEHIRIPFTDELVGRTLALLEEARRAARSGEIPPPLVNSSKCPRCSLVGICLPDETNILRACAKGVGATVQPARVELRASATSEARRLIPARDDRLAVYVQGQGLSVGLKGETLEIRDKGKAVSDARLLDTSQLNLFGNVQLSAQALRELAAREIPVLHLSYGGWLAAVTTPPPHKNIELRRRQFAAASDPAACLALARSFVSGKIRNQRTLLRRNARELPENLLYRLAFWRKRAERETSLESLLGVEGTAARDYFSNFALMFKPGGGDKPPAFDFNTRNRRPPRDPVNTLLSFLYSMLAKEMLVALIGVGFDPYQGFYHRPRYGRPALALDLMEEFRPLVADSVVIGLVNNGEVRPSDFLTRAGAVALTEGGRRRVLEAFERRLDTLVTHPRFGYQISYRRVFEVQARLLARFLSGEIAAYPPFCTR